MSEMPSPPTLSIVIPLFKESGIVRELIFQLGNVLDPMAVPYEIILVDDGSPDDTWTVIIEVINPSNNIRAIRLSRNFGKEAALCAGIEKARGLAVITMDGDLQHPPALIPQMYMLWHDKKFDVVEAVKQSRGHETYFNKKSAALFYSVFKMMTNYDLRGSSDYKLMDRKVVDAWLLMGERNVFFRGMNAWLGFKREKIPFAVSDRKDGKSGWSISRLTSLALTALTAFTATPLHLITLMGLIFVVFAILLSLQTLYNKFAGIAVSGFTTVIILILFTSCILMFALGLIGQYIARIYEEVKGRPRYVVDQMAEKQQQ